MTQAGVGEMAQGGGAVRLCWRRKRPLFKVGCAEGQNGQAKHESALRWPQVFADPLARVFRSTIP